jgi:hypothetical protein
VTDIDISSVGDRYLEVSKISNYKYIHTSRVKLTTEHSNINMKFFSPFSSTDS